MTSVVTATQASAVTASPPAAAERAPEDDAKAAEFLEHARQLRATVEQVTPEEFRWQESHYDHDSRHGRELLFLIANNEWVRATSEIVDVTRSDAVDTIIKIDIDTDQIIHEAFRKRTGRLWLPVIVLPPQAAAVGQYGLDQHRLEPDPFATVTDAAGGLLPMLPKADVRHQISAAMAEIIVNMAVARWFGPDDMRPTATRDQRLLLSAAIYRMPRRGPARLPAGTATAGTAETATAATALNRPALSRFDNAKDQLLKLLDDYISLLVPQLDGPHRTDAPSTGTVSTGTDSAADGSNAALSPVPERDVYRFAPELTRRAVKVLQAFADSVVVVVPVDRESTPTVLTVRVPARDMDHERQWKWTSPSTWILRPLGRLEIDVLTPSADADRQVQVNLPDGVFFEESGATPDEAAFPSLVIEVERPQPLKDLASLMAQLLNDPRIPDWPAGLQQCLADLARAKAETAREILRHYRVGSARAGHSTDPGGTQLDANDAAHGALDALCREFDQVFAARPMNRETQDNLRAAWETFDELTGTLYRRTSADRSSPPTVVARTDTIEDVFQRAVPKRAKVNLHVAVTDAEYFSIARFSGAMSILLMTAVLVLIPVAGLLGYGQPSPEVLAIVLTLFSAIQAGRIERSDRSTLRGLLAAAGNFLIVASILPPVILAVILAFSPSRPWALLWAAIGIGLQSLLLLAMWRGPLTATGSPRPTQRRQFKTQSQDYHHGEALQSNYWRRTTANALLIGRKAYAYVIAQEEDGRSATLTELLTGAQRTSPGGVPQAAAMSGSGPAAADSGSAVAESHNVLALVRSGTVRQALTFVVFRDEPTAGWARAHVEDLDLDPDRLAPSESVTSTVNVFVGVRRDKRLRVADHPVTSVLAAAAAYQLPVREVQLPMPPPGAAYTDWHWARVQVGLRDDVDLSQLVAFLDAIRKRTAVSTDEGPAPLVGVQTVPAGGPRIIAAPPDRTSASGRPVLASDMDVVNTPANGAEPADAQTWRVLGICGDALSGIENDIVQRLGEECPDLELAGLTYALLHGTAVLLLLGHEPNSYHPGLGADLEKRLRDGGRALAKLRVLTNRWLSRQQLGRAADQPLLHVHFRAQDRPGALLDVLDSLGKALKDEPQLSLGPDEWQVWHAQTQITAGHAVARLTVRLSTHHGEIDWRPGTSEEIERKVRTLARRKAAAAAVSVDGAFGGELDTAEDPVISISPVKTPASTP
jgi:hypothetical protein